MVLTVAVLVVPIAVVFGKSGLDLRVQRAFDVDVSVVGSMPLFAEVVDSLVAGETDDLAFDGVGSTQNHHITKRSCHGCARWWFDSFPKVGVLVLKYTLTHVL